MCFCHHMHYPLIHDLSVYSLIKVQMLLMIRKANHSQVYKKMSKMKISKMINQILVKM